MGYTVTIETRNDRQSSRLYELMREYYNYINKKDYENVKTMTIVPKDHPYTPENVEHGLSVTFSTFSTIGYYFLMNFGKLSTNVLQTRLFCDDIDITDESGVNHINWPTDNSKMFFITKFLLYRNELNHKNYFENAIAPRLEQVKGL